MGKRNFRPFVGDVNLDKNGGLPAWRRGKVRKYYPENTIVFSG